MKKIAGQAWEVRGRQRRNLVNKIQQKIRCEVNVVGFDLYLMLHHKLEREVFPRSEIDDNIFPAMSAETRAQAHLSFMEAFKVARGFQRSEEEGNSILAELFAWTGNQLAMTCHEALLRQARENPMLVYGVKKSTDLVPIE